MNKKYTILIALILILLIVYLICQNRNNFTVMPVPKMENKRDCFYKVIYTRNKFTDILNASAQFICPDIEIPNNYDTNFGAADPFIYRGYVFAEIIKSKNKGSIAVAKLIPKQPLKFEVILEDSFHFSYPFIYEENGRVYMIPETYQSGFIKLYECIRFPDKWVFVKNLIKLPGIDTVIIPYKDFKCLMITNNNNGEQMHTYVSNSILNPFTEVKTDIPEMFRGAGGMLDGKYLPRQKNIDFYGQYIDIYDMSTWEIVSTLRPEQPILGNHHISQDPYTDFIVMDIKLKLK